MTSTYFSVLIIVPLLSTGLCFKEVKSFVPIPRRDSKRKNTLTMSPWPDEFSATTNTECSHPCPCTFSPWIHTVPSGLDMFRVMNESLPFFLFVMCNYFLNVNCSLCHISEVSCKCIVTERHRVYCKIYCNIVFGLKCKTHNQLKCCVIQINAVMCNIKCLYVTEQPWGFM